jgi:hypothetical protein
MHLPTNSRGRHCAVVKDLEVRKRSAQIPEPRVRLPSSPASGPIFESRKKQQRQKNPNGTFCKSYLLTIHNFSGHQFSDETIFNNLILHLGNYIYIVTYIN